MAPMPTAAVNGIEIFYETQGEPGNEPLLLVMGLGGQLVAWDQAMVDLLVERGFHVIRFDNRDVGLSTSFRDGYDTAGSMAAFFAGEQPAPPYRLADMAADAAALVDHLGLGRVHVLGVSMGGMISQQLAIDHHDKVATLTSIMSTTGDPDVGSPTPEALSALMGSFGSPVTTREHAVEVALVVWNTIGSPGHVDPARVRRRAEESYDRNPDGSAVLRQLLAIMTSPSRSDALRDVTAPTMVIHGDVDPLVTVSGGIRTAEVVPGAELHIIPGMGHDIHEAVWPEVMDLVEAHTKRARATA
jgi:pimeloyl-ACP methyl ester carboxylesterase